jgi:hypothetical protein
MGHLGQLAPVVQTLMASFQAIRVVVRSAHPDHMVHDFIGSPVEVDEPPPEAMLVSRDPTTIDPVASEACGRLSQKHWMLRAGRQSLRLEFGKRSILLPISRGSVRPQLDPDGDLR